MLWWSYRFHIFNSTETSTSLWRWDTAVPVILVFASASEEEVISWALAPTHLLQFISYIVISCLKSISCFCYWLVIYWHGTSRHSFIRRDFNFCLKNWKNNEKIIQDVEELNRQSSNRLWLTFIEQLTKKGGASLVTQMVKNLTAMQKTWVWSLGWEEPLEKGMATHSSILAWRILWTEEPGRL